MSIVSWVASLLRNARPDLGLLRWAALAVLALLVAAVTLVASVVLKAPRSGTGPGADVGTSATTQRYASVVVLHADCRLETLLVPPEQVPAFIGSLPASGRVTVLIEPTGTTPSKAAPAATVYAGREPDDCLTRVAGTPTASSTRYPHEPSQLLDNLG